MFKKILLLDTSVATQNTGDEIILSSIRKNYPELFSDNYVYNLPTHTQLFSIIQQIIGKRVVESYSNADFKFLCGTNALYKNMFQCIPGWNINPFNADIVKGTICLGVGLRQNSKNVNWYTKYLYSKVLSKKYIHSVRDEATKLFLEDLGFKAYNTGCPTLWGLTPEFCRTIPKEKSNRVVFTLTGYEADVENDKLMINILSENYTDLFFWPQTFNDLEYLRSITDLPIHIISPNLQAYDKILDMDDIDYVGNRLHGGIRALQHAKRTIIISIDHRAEDMARTYSLPKIKRTEIASRLNDMINSTSPILITGLDFALIEKWKKQFEQ